MRVGGCTGEGAHVAGSSEPRSSQGARRGASNEPRSPQGARSGVGTSFSNAPRTILARFLLILARFWTLRGSILEVFQCFFDTFALELANSLEEEATSVKPVKTTRKLQVLTCFPHVRASAHDAKINRKSFRTRFSTVSRDGSPSKAAFVELRSLKMVPRGLSGVSLGALERLLGRSWALLRRSWGALGRSWSALGMVLGRSCGAVGRSWALLGRSWAAPGPS